MVRLYGGLPQVGRTGNGAVGSSHPPEANQLVGPVMRGECAGQSVSLEIVLQTGRNTDRMPFRLEGRASPVMGTDTVGGRTVRSGVEPVEHRDAIVLFPTRITSEYHGVSTKYAPAQVPETVTSAS